MWQRKYLVIFSVLVLLISDSLIVKYREDEATSIKSACDFSDSLCEQLEEFENSDPQVKVQCSTLACDLRKVDEQWEISEVSEGFLVNVINGWVIIRVVSTEIVFLFSVFKWEVWLAELTAHFWEEWKRRVGTM
jgi:hypothetical protein